MPYRPGEAPTDFGAPYGDCFKIGITAAGGSSIRQQTTIEVSVERNTVFQAPNAEPADIGSRSSVDKAMAGSLQDKLDATTLDREVRRAILDTYWGQLSNPTSDGLDESSTNTYFEYYKQQCCLASLNDKRHISARVHEDLARVVKLVQAKNVRQNIVEIVKADLQSNSQCINDTSIEGTIDLTARVYTMVTIGELPNALTGPDVIHWTTGSLQDCLAQRFVPQLTADSKNVRFEKLFVAHNLERVAGLRIEWTSDLSHHLRMLHDDTAVAIFHHASVVRLHQQRQVHLHFPRDTGFQVPALDYSDPGRNLRPAPDRI